VTNWLLTFLLAHSVPTTLNAWACDTVYKLEPNQDGGCYDICYLLFSVEAKLATGHKVSVLMFSDHDGVPHDLKNACAIVMDGGEY